ncbi:MAG TPA: hypothetical protein VN697_05435, partial [Tepidiformaceae bacterium]|nr:hypothetical protein [Tepidiformaceae bacterium]
APGVVNFNGPLTHMVRNGSSAYAEANIPSGRIAIFVFPADADTGAITTADGLAVYATVGAPRLLVWATETFGVGSNPGRPYYASVAADGHLWVSAEPIPQFEAIDQQTGEALNVLSARQLGEASAPGQFGTSCEPAGVCSLVVMGEFAAPEPGTIRCDAQGRFEFVDSVDGSYFTFEPFSADSPPDCPPSPQHVAGKDAVIIGSPVVHAFDAAGMPMSLAAGGDGKLYMGVFAPKAGCPCFPRD